MVRDEDGFGLPGAPAVPADGTLWRDGLGGNFWTDYRDAGDLAGAPFTDQWFSDAGITYRHAYDLAGATPLSALLSVQLAGVADDRGPWDVYYEGTLAGQIPTNVSENAFQEVLSYSFPVDVSLLTGSDTVLLNINVPTPTDGYSINFSQLWIETQGCAVPVPGALLLAAMGTGVVTPMRRRRVL